jgi:hypothetical protein
MGNDRNPTARNENGGSMAAVLMLEAFQSKLLSSCGDALRLRQQGPRRRARALSARGHYGYLRRIGERAAYRRAMAKAEPDMTPMLS